MKSHEESKTGVEGNLQKKVEARRSNGSKVLRDVKSLWKELGFSAGFLKGTLVQGPKKK